MSSVYGFAGHDDKNQGRTLKNKFMKKLGQVMTQDIHHFKGRELLMNCFGNRIANCHVTSTVEESKWEGAVLYIIQYTMG